MTRAVALLLWCAALFVPASAAADPRLVPDVSSRAIEIQYSFTGEVLLLFGEILYPGQRLPDDRADIVDALTGPVRHIILREERRVAGVCLQHDSIRMRTPPGFYPNGSYL